MFFLLDLTSLTLAIISAIQAWIYMIAKDLMDDDGMDDLNDSGPESDDAVLWRRLILDAVKRGAVESVHHSGSRRFKHLRYHPCYFNPISCFKKRDAEWLGHWQPYPPPVPLHNPTLSLYTGVPFIRYHFCLSLFSTDSNPLKEMSIITGWNYSSSDVKFEACLWIGALYVHTAVFFNSGLITEYIDTFRCATPRWPFFNRFRTMRMTDRKTSFSNVIVMVQFLDL